MDGGMDGWMDGWMDGSCFGSFKGISGETKKQKGNPPKKKKHHPFTAERSQVMVMVTVFRYSKKETSCCSWFF